MKGGGSVAELGGVVVWKFGETLRLCSCEFQILPFIYFLNIHLVRFVLFAKL